MDQKIGAYSFIAGVVIAIVGGVFASFLPQDVALLIPLVLVVLGLIVGLINVTDKETKEFLIASIALLVVGGAGLRGIPFGIGFILDSVMLDIGAFVAPAALIVALKAVYNLAKNP